MQRSFYVALAVLGLICVNPMLSRPVAATASCHLYLAKQSSGTLGFGLSIKTDVAGCPLNSANLVFTVGTNTFVASEPWTPQDVFTAQVVLRSAGPQDLYFNGVWIGSLPGRFQPAPGPVVGSDDEVDQPDAAYVVNQLSMQISNGANTLSIQPNNGDAVSPALIALTNGPAPWPAPFTIDPSSETTVTVTFEFNSPVPVTHFDRYGQATAASWPGKILDATAASQLQAAATAEQTWLAANPPPAGFDPHGGSMFAGWSAAATGYFHTAFRHDRWWLISPEGNPLFYIGVTGVFPYTTPLTGREPLFEGLPQAAGPFAPAYSTSADQAVTYYSPVVANEILKYCGGTDCNFQHISEDLERQRLASWGFAGVGKFAHTPANLPAVPVLEHDPAKVPAPLSGVPNLVLNGHPDVFDLTRLKQLRSTLEAQIYPDKTNSYIVGWGVGNEKDEIVTSPEISAMLLLDATVPAKRALVDYAFLAVYHGNLGDMNRAWGTRATTLSQLYALKPTTLSDGALEPLREFYEGAYYLALYQIVKSIDPKHLYFGSWIVTGDANLSIDWRIAAANCDVIGFDDFTPGPLSADLTQLFQTTNKPVLLGAFGAPADYGGTRGFGWSRYTQALTLSDTASGDDYAQRLQSAGADPHVIGAMWFDYHDEPISGRGGTGEHGDSTGAPVIGEDFAFGLLDVTDTPKYDLVNRVRAANLAVLQALGLLGGGHLAQGRSGAR